MIDSGNKPQEAEMIEKCGVKIPKLDFSSIFIQREAVPTQHNGEVTGTEDEIDSDQDLEDVEDSEVEVDSKAK